MIIRPFEYRDYPAVAALTEQFGKPITAEDLRSRDLSRTHLHWFREVAETADGEVAGFCYGMVDKQTHPGKFAVNLHVAKPFRRHGLGDRLNDSMERHLRREGAIRLYVSVAEQDEDSLNFAERRGYTRNRLSFESAITPQTFDATPYEPLRKKLESEGVSFVPFSEIEDREQGIHDLFQVNLVAGYDVPGEDEAPWPDVESFRRTVVNAPWFRGAGQILAYQDEIPIALGAVGEPKKDHYYNLFTGVLREHRGRGLATALKVLGIQFAKNAGAETLLTHNDSRNAPMIAINQKLGYQNRPGWYRMEKTANKGEFI